MPYRSSFDANPDVQFYSRFHSHTFDILIPVPMPPLQLHIIIQQHHLLTRLERRQPNIRTPITSERIPQTTVSTTTDLPGHCKVDFGQVVGLQFKGFEGCVGVGAFGGVFGFETLGETAGAVFAGAAAFSFGFAFGCCGGIRVSML